MPASSGTGPRFPPGSGGEQFAYASHFGLTGPPFSVTPDPRFLYMSEHHREALAHLLYGIGEGGGFVQLTGEVGTGKTTLCRCLLEQLPPRVDVALILDPKLTDVELLATLCDELRIAYPAGTTSRKLLVDALYHRLLDGHSQGHRTVLIIDEAQDLAPQVLEQLRLLTNLETPTQKLLQIILIGQPELMELLDREDLRQLAQRVTARYHLLPFDEDDSRAYVRHRLAVAGQKQKIFTDRAMRRVHRAARGIPRLINAICDRALLGAYTQDERRVDAATVRRAAREVLRGPRRRRASRAWRWAGAAVGMVALITLGGWILLTHGPAGLGIGGRLSGATNAGAAPGALPAPPAVSPSPSTAGAREVPLATPKPPDLAALLSDPSLPADKKSAFTSLYARWGLAFGGSKDGLACERGRPEGLQCLFKAGTWAKLRRFDLPAIIELSTPSGDLRYATAVALDDEAATLDFGGRRYTFRLSVVDQYWDGSFIVLWKAPAVRSLPITPGTRGKDVEWVRQRLGEIDGSPVAGGNSDVFDDELRSRVIAFQRDRSLVADGIVGEETLTHLSTARRDPSVPRLWRAGS